MRTGRGRVVQNLLHTVGDGIIRRYGAWSVELRACLLDVPPRRLPRGCR
ncbi:MAG: hypothetical protein ACI9SE_001714 [Neolewinella sp.]|jgi:hypothetical protein